MKLHYLSSVTFHLSSIICHVFSLYSILFIVLSTNLAVTEEIEEDEVTPVEQMTVDMTVILWH